MEGKKLVRSSSTGAWLWRWLGLLLVLVLLVSGGPVGAQGPEPKVIPIPAVDKLVIEGDVRNPAEFNPKLDSALNQLLEVQRVEGMSGARTFGQARQMVLEGDKVQVILITEPAAMAGLVLAVEGQGGEIQGDYKGLLQALVPLDALEPLADRPDVQLIRDPWRAIELEVPEVGSATTEGVAASNAAAWHTAGHDGSGVRVAVIDGGFTDYATLLGSDLPGSVGTYNWASGDMGGSKHGTACAEIVHDMAPGAAMDLHKVSTVVDLSQAVTQAIGDGVDVISMSLGWILDGPGDGTGYLADIVNTARASGIFYATAAGNDAEVNWAGTYVDSGTSSYHAWNGGSSWYNFMGEGTSCVVFPAGYPIRGGLHWDDWSAVNQNYDLHLVRWPGSGSELYLVASSTNLQNGGGGQTPEEFISYTAAGGNCYAWVVERVSSTRNVCLRMIAPKTNHFVYWTAGKSLTYPADSADAITVAAVDVNSPYPLESYSSQGPTFGSGGACSGGATKPDIASYANVSTVSYGPGGFNGTSAATPHVAGAAALVKQRYPSSSVTELQDYLEKGAIDLGTAGKDNLYGSGRLHLPDPTALVVFSITPDHGENTAIVTAVVSGSNFQSGATAKLTKSSQTDINGTCGEVVNSSQITCDFDLTAVATGAWNVVVTNPDLQSGMLQNGFTVTSPGGKTYVYLPIVIRRYPPVPYTPTLNPISNADGDGNYTVSWSTAELATSYELQEDDNSAFSSPTVVYSGAGISRSISGKAPGTYYYRVRGCNSYGCGLWSETRSVVVSPPSGPTPGFWEGSAMEFYVTSGRDYVDDFAIYIYVSGCGGYKITHHRLEPIANNHFSFSGSFWGNGTFGSPTSCSGTAGLSSFYIAGCGYVTGSSSYTATWQSAASATTDPGADRVVVEKMEEDALQSFLTAEKDRQ